MRNCCLPILMFSVLTVSAMAKERDADEAVGDLQVGEDLQVTVFASEPQLLSPSNIDIDHRGRVWVLEVVNYRTPLNPNNEHREEGDRIIVLEDTDGDAVADQTKLFYQGPELDGGHGVCVLGNRIIVSAQDSVFILTDEDGDDRADRKDLLFTGIDGALHDHGIHAFVFGPDGKLYFNFGNAGMRLRDKHGNPITDLTGTVVESHGKPYREGMVFRCNLDGSDLETLAWNFRNNWEISVDSFGTLWQSDNDDDGNRGTRINFVMEFGNYGYRDEMTGAGWVIPRVGMHQEIPLRHWHLRDPGVVPNLLQNGAGAPAGICFYEGELLPTIGSGQMIHCDPGTNEVRVYPVESDGAGYSAKVVMLVKSKEDQWFRPADVCVAPDGSLIIADWYDPGVGGHTMVDQRRGRLFRVAPAGSRYVCPQFDFRSVAGALNALLSPNLATRYLAWTQLNEMQVAAEPSLLKLFQDTASRSRHRARGLWLLGNIQGREQHYVDLAVRDADPDIRIVGLRLARQKKLDLIELLGRLVDDPEPSVRRECAVALRHESSPSAIELWTRLAKQYDGQDRWYLEALGIAAEQKWDACLDHWLNSTNGQWSDPAGRGIVWRSRARRTPSLLVAALRDPSLPEADVPRFLRALDFVPATQRDAAIAELIARRGQIPETRQTLVIVEAADRLPAELQSQADVRTAVDSVLDDLAGSSRFIGLVNRFAIRSRYVELLQMAIDGPDSQTGIESARVLVSKDPNLIRMALATPDESRAVAVAQALVGADDGRAIEQLMPLLSDDQKPIAVRAWAVRGAVGTLGSGNHLVAMVKRGELDDRLLDAAAAALHGSGIPELQDAAAEFFPLPPAKDSQPIPPIAELVEREGDPVNGARIFDTAGTCAKCHVVNGIGVEVGPNLSEIGDKLSRQAMLESILFPSAGISHNYEAYSVFNDDGTTVTGLLVSQTDDSVSIRDPKGVLRELAREAIEEIVRQDVSLMPSDLQKLMTAEELVDVVTYMETLRRADETD